MAQPALTRASWRVCALACKKGGRETHALPAHAILSLLIMVHAVDLLAIVHDSRSLPLGFGEDDVNEVFRRRDWLYAFEIIYRHCSEFSQNSRKQGTKQSATATDGGARQKMSWQKKS
jgi:hypothetical protein